MSGSTAVARRLAAVGSFCAYAAQVGAVTGSPVTGVRRPRTGERYVELTPALTRDELGRVLAAAAAPRDRALVLVLVVLGLRVSEALGLDLDAVEDVRGHATVVVHGKGGREDRAPLPPLLLDALDDLARAEARSSGPARRPRVTCCHDRDSVSGLT